MNRNAVKPLLLAIVSAYATQALHVQAEETLDIDKVEVYSTTPLKGIGLPLYKVPANIQMANPAAINNQVGVSIADYMNNNMQGVTVTELGGNPWQPEINFRGYSASSLLGNPQGLSTYIDGVRVNEPFGDVTSWDKIPSFAIGDMQLVPGSNPLYGLNTLGGAIAIQTKSGRNNQGAALEYEAGSWGRQRALAEYGGVSKDGSVDYMIGFQHTTEDGWRKYSPSHVNQLFAKTGWQSETTKLDLTYIGADNNLIGNGLTPEFLLHGDRDQINTRPDQTNNYSHFLALNASHWLNSDTLLSGNVYYKKSNRRTKNGDGFDAEVEGGEELEGYPGVTCPGPGDCDLSGAVMNSTQTSQNTYGMTGQATFNQDFLGKENQFVVGAGYDYSLIRFKQSEQINIAEADGATVGESDPVFDDTRAPILDGPGALGQRQSVGLTGKQYTARLFASDTLSLNDFWHLNAGASWNFTRVDNTDTLRGPASAANNFNSLTAKDSYTRLNPTVGLTYTPTKALTLYTSYSESSRAPTAIEVGCSNPAAPCLLPAAMADDPPLNQVVAKTYEAGGRGQLTDNVFWNAGVYHAVNHDDIQFTAANSQTGAGYFKNVGRTKRQGIDMGLNGFIDNFKWSASYSFVRATYDSDVEFVNESNSSGVNSDGVYTARPGDRIPGIPQHQLKLRGQYAVTPSWNVGANVVGYSSQYVLGNENNSHRANAADCNGGDDCATGRGKLGGYFIVNLDSQYNFGNGWKVFAKATNIFDKEYNIAGRLAESMFDASGTFGDESKVLSLLPGAPRAGWIGLRYEFKPKQSVASYDPD
ncbi:Outer membrane receptor proteins, mostly Fe transport [Methylophilus rhizosphaerae]|uniref:Outer membrane receptor proteins, mostly Fe transport n=1 Tax=Methylophilus rhizosphaerae TaxID=492660 RepID=A0A1G9AWF3_9PROT|nr:TonB-dependent receptor [Methylophilus rhizosphaerae]SDK31602.1 Outer membrane receptor proteins, mostly Fe transport [Methylophilus rhizosphaerae]